MIYAANRLVGQFFTVDAVNTQLQALCVRLGLPLLQLQTEAGVQNIWSKTFREITRPGIGYAVGILQDGWTELKRQGKNRMMIPMFVDCQSAATDTETAMDQIGLLFQAAMYVLENAELAQLSLTGVTPPVQLVHLPEPVNFQMFVSDAAAAGKILLARARWNLELYDVRQ